MNPRRMAVEDRVLALADELNGVDTIQAARLRETVPDGDGHCDQHVSLMRGLIEQVGKRYESFSPQVARLLATLDDLPSVIGRRGTVWIGGERRTPGRFSAHWADSCGWLEAGPDTAELDGVMNWAAARSDDVRIQRRQRRDSGHGPLRFMAEADGTVIRLRRQDEQGNVALSGRHDLREAALALATPEIIRSLG